MFSHCQRRNFKHISQFEIRVVLLTGDEVTSFEGILCDEEDPLRPNIEEKALLIVFLVFLASCPKKEIKCLCQDELPTS